jgi:hypothetical protein
MKVIELFIDEEGELSGIDAISIVEQPAIEENFVALKDELKVELADVDKDKRILMGAALIPNKKIYRKSREDEYYIYFSEDTVRRASELFLMKGNQNKSTLEHQAQLSGMSVVESWIIEDDTHDKSRKYGLNMPVGTWMVSMKVNNEEVWQNYVKTGKVKGFSIEGYFTDKIARSMIQKENDAAEVLLEIADSIEAGKLNLKTYGDYGSGVRNNAKRGIELNKKVNNRCATSVGKIRAQQLSRGEKLSVSTIKRMYSYLSRAAEYYDPSDSKACGTISYLLWGGKAGLAWSRGKLKELGEIELASKRIDNRLAYDTKEQALKVAKDIGCDGYHVHKFDGKDWYMPCKEHKLAEYDDKGRIKRSKKAPDSDTPNPNPKRGSKRNPKGAAGKSRGVTVPDRVLKSLQKKADDFNEKYKAKKGYGTTVGQLKSVYQRGVGAFQTSHSPAVKSAEQWAQARVNAYIYLLKNGRPQNAKYTTDYDLLPKKHPKSSKK